MTVTITKLVPQIQSNPNRVLITRNFRKSHTTLITSSLCFKVKGLSESEAAFNLTTFNLITHPIAARKLIQFSHGANTGSFMRILR